MTDHLKPWEWSSAWKTKAAYFSWLRGQIRRIWTKYPVKADFKRSRLRPVTQEEREQKLFHPSTKQVGQCEHCRKWFPGSKLEVDHITPTEGCTSIGGAQEFLLRMAAEPVSNMSLLCKEHHNVKSYADLMGISIEEAIIQKAVLAAEKKHGKGLQRWLISKGFPPEDTSNKPKRRDCLEQLIREGRL